MTLLTIDDKQYPIDTLSDEAKAQLISLRACDCAGEKIRQAIFRGFFPFNGQSFELNPHQKRASLTGCQAK